MSQQLDASLRTAAAALMQAARIREAELGREGLSSRTRSTSCTSRSVALPLCRGGHPDQACRGPDWVREAAREAERAGTARRDLETREDHILRLCTPSALPAPTAGLRGRRGGRRLELGARVRLADPGLPAAALAALLLVAGGATC